MLAEEEKTLSECGVGKGAVIFVKDKGSIAEEDHKLQEFSVSTYFS